MKKLIFFLTLLITIKVYSIDFKESLSLGKIDTFKISLDMNPKQAVQVLGEPLTKLNISGLGYYGYKNIGIWFDDALIFNSIKVKYITF